MAGVLVELYRAQCRPKPPNVQEQEEHATKQVMSNNMTSQSCDEFTTLLLGMEFTLAEVSLSIKES
eukprot:6483240-Amphidinium_carterae.1